jgi:phosphohistidine swiveling domain-containing protein
MVTSFEEDFAVIWTDSADAELTWLYDPMHFPRPIAPLAAEFLDRLYAEFMSARTVFVNGYAFSTVPTPRPPTPAILERGILDVWTKDFQPRIETNARAVRGAGYEQMALPELGNAVEQAFNDSVSAFGLTMEAITGFMGPTFGLVAFLQEALGGEGPQLAASLLQGQENGTAAAGLGLSALVDAATARPTVAEALRGGHFDSLSSVEGGPEFTALLNQYLDEFGWRTESWGVIHRPTWAEDPQQPLAWIARYLAEGADNPRAAIERASEQREAATDQIESRLTPEQRTQLQGMLEAARAHVPVSEGRALWQLITIGSLRVPVLELGRRLVAAGALEEAEHAFFLTSSELREGAHQPSAAIKELAASRHSDHNRWEELSPPPFLGPPLDMASMPPEMVPLVTLFFGAAPPEVQGREIKGQAASRGVVTGRARIIRDLSDGARLERGDILVCQMTAPPWTPLFAIASAVVTDTGGVLSHSAICAREYGIPCVVATQVATHVIEEGATITVDGAAGLVRIEA